MKAQYIVLPFLFILGCCAISFAQKATPAHLAGIKNETVKVWGNCGMCKKTIETAAKKAGATTADWNTETKVLSVSYDSKKTNNQKIQQLVAAAGYDTKDLTASDEAYNKLHSCCQYDRKADSKDAGARCCDQEKCGKDADCCKDMKCCDGNDCCKKDGAASCCIEGECEKDKDCCKDMAQCKERDCCKS